MSKPNSIDTIALTVFANRCRAVAETMAFTLYRTAFSTFVKETEDFTTGIACAKGRTFASPRELGATWFTALDYGGAIDLVDGYEEGDICITNDPYSGFVSTHTPDVHLWKPVFHEGRIVCFSVSHIHNTDMGGAVPASVSRSLVEIHQEGIRIPARKLVSAGRIDNGLLDLMLANVRNPDRNWGDLKAQIAAINTGERGALDVVRRLGADAFERNVDQLFALAERQARELLRSVPDGDYEFSDFIDEDSVNGLPCRLMLTLRVRGDSAELDFTGSDPQVNAAMNMPTGGHARHALLTIGLMYVLYSLDPSIQLNAGLLRPFTCVAPEGSVLNASYPAAVGMRSITCVRLMGVVLGAFGRAMPGRLPAAPSSGGPIVNVQTSDPRSGQRRMASIGPVTGGSGGAPLRDGPEGSGGTNSFLKNTPIEISEAELPILFHSYGLAPDSGGAGLHRGGMATRVVIEAISPQTVVTARNRDRSRFNCWGAAGGRAGGLSAFRLNSGTPVERDLGNTDIVSLQPGDRLLVQAGGSGGWGDPLQRPVEAVLKDVLNGFVTAERAREDYGVIVAEGKVDAMATAALRAEMSAKFAALAAASFDFGPGRRSFERDWNDEAYRKLTAILGRVPANWRFFVKHQIFARRAAHADDIDAAFESLIATMPQLANAVRESA